MGWYIQGPALGKAKYIMDNHDAIRIPVPKSYSEIPEGYAMICVVLNGPFEAAGFAINESEFKVFTGLDDRPREFLLMDRKKACELSGYKGP